MILPNLECKEQLMMKKEFELSILPQQDGNKQIYLFSKNAGQFFYAQNYLNFQQLLHLLG